MASHTGILAWEIPWTEEPSGLQSMGVAGKSDMNERLDNDDHHNQVTKHQPRGSWKC